MSSRNNEEFRRARSRFEEINKAIGRNLVRNVARQGAVLAQKEAKRIAKFVDRTGVGRKSIVVKEKRAPVGQASFVVGFSRMRGFGKARSGFYIRFIEEGTQRHPIVRGTYLERIRGKTTGRILTRNKLGSTTTWQGSELKITLSGGRTIIRPLVMHPGIVARPFLAQALHNATPGALANRDRLVHEAIREVASK